MCLCQNNKMIRHYRSKRINDLKKSIDNLKQFNHPDLYISNYFNDLNKDISIAFEERLLNEEDINVSSVLKLDWIQIVQKIKTIENDCLSVLDDQTFGQTLKETIDRQVKMIEKKFDVFLLKNQNVEYKDIIEEKIYLQIQEINDLVYNNSIKIGKILFINRTVVFIDKKSCKNQKLFEDMNEKTTVGILLIIHNEYFGKRGIELIIEAPWYLTNVFYKHLTREKMLCHCFKMRFEKYLEKNKFIKKIITEIDFEINEFKSIRIHKNSVKKMDYSVFNDFENIIRLNLCCNELSELHPEIFHRLFNLEWIDLSENRLETIHVGIFSKTKILAQISLRTNKISVLDAKIFQGLTNLKEIKLDFNFLKEIDPSLLKGLKSLELFSISNNQIESIDKGLFKDCTNLNWFNCSKNNLTEIPTQLFQGLTNLEDIECDFNEITDLDENIFRELLNLKGIGLAGNRLTKIPANLLNGDNLRTVDFHDNLLSSIDVNIFKNVKNLRDINLSGNQLNEVSPKIFNNLESLVFLSLAHNDLKSLDIDIFKGLNNLKEIYLNSNRLNVIDPFLFNGLNKIKIVKIYDNPFKYLGPERIIPLDFQNYLDSG